MAQLLARVLPITSLTVADRVRMFELMERYHDDVGPGRFLADLAAKDHVILLRDPLRGNAIQGFSTLATVELPAEAGSARARGIFSGDTVIDRAYWGDRALGRAFLGYLFRQGLRRPWQPLHWLVTPKGYKAYLLMANNFREHYPRHERPTPPGAKRLMDRFYARLHPDRYDAANGILRPEAAGCRLKHGVAATSPALVRDNARVAFFERTNPRWHEGAELCCLARMAWGAPLAYAAKGAVKAPLAWLARAAPRSIARHPAES